MPEVALRELFETLSEKFTLARSALNCLSDRFLKHRLGRYFDIPAQRKRNRELTESAFPGEASRV